MPCGANQNVWVMVDRSDRMWSTGEVNGKTLWYSCLENPMISMKRQNDRILKRGTPQVGRCPICYWRSVRNNSRKNEGLETKQKQCPVVDVTGDRSKVHCCKEQYCIRSDQIRSVAQSCLTFCDPMMLLNCGVGEDS